MLSLIDYVCATGLLVGMILLYCFIRLPVEDGKMVLPAWAKKLVESKGAVIVRTLLTLMLWVSFASVIGIITWKAIEGIAEVVTASSFEIFVAALVGAVASMIGFALFALVLSLFGPILSMVYERWVGYIAPVIGGAVGAAISEGLAINLIYIVPLSALTGGLALVTHEVITAKEGVTFKGITAVILPGVVFGAINGAIVGGVFKLLEVTVGIGWMLAG